MGDETMSEQIDSYKEMIEKKSLLNHVNILKENKY